MVSLKNTSRRPSGFVEPCRPSKAVRPPSGPLWIHEIKHDGFRLMVRREGSRVRCFTRGGHDWADRFPAIVEAASRLRTQSFLIDGEAVICGDDGLSDFNALRSRRRDREAVLFAFDLIEHEGDDLRELPLIDRKRRLAKLLGKANHATTDSTSIWHTMVRPCSIMPAGWDWKASCRSGWTRPIGADHPRRGSSQKIR
jgi:ATP-dependent DNA ligase